MAHADIDHAIRGPSEELASKLISVRESQWYERKSIRVSQQKLAEAFVGMANAEGGWIAVGLSEGRVENIDADTGVLNKLLKSADRTQPRVRAKPHFVSCIDADGVSRRLALFQLDPSDVVHRTVNGDCLLRVGDETRHLTDLQASELEHDKGSTRYETTIVRDATQDGIDAALLANYARRLGYDDPLRALEDRTLSANQATVAGCLLFWSYPQKYLPNAIVRVTRYRGITRLTGKSQNIVFDDRLEGPLPTQILGAQRLVKEHQPTRLALGDDGMFQEIPTVPEDAWLEGVVNAAVHRSYSLDGDYVHVDIFDDRIEIFSPGRFPHVTDLSDPLGIRRYARNPRIVRVCFDMKICQEMGEGIRRIYNEMRSAGLRDPLYTQEMSGVTLTLSSAPINEVLDDRFPEGIREIMGALRMHKRMSTAEIVDALDGMLSRPAVRNRLHALRKEGLLDWYGKSAKDPRAYWFIPEENNPRIGP